MKIYHSILICFALSYIFLSCEKNDNLPRRNSKDFKSPYYDTNILYRLDDTTGAVIDANGMGDGINHGAQRGVEGKVNNSYLFDEDYVEIPRLPVFDNFTLFAWVKSEGNMGADQNSPVILARRAEEGGKTDPFVLSVDDDGGDEAQISIIVVSDYEVSRIEVEGETDVADDKWHFIAATFKTDPLEGSPSKLKIYVDAQLEDTEKIRKKLKLYKNKEDEIIIGEQWKGLIDEVGISNRVLSEDEIKIVYNEGSGVPNPFDRIN